MKRMRRYRALQASTAREQMGRQRLATGRFQLHGNEMSDGNNQEIPGGKWDSKSLTDVVPSFQGCRACCAVTKFSYSVEDAQYRNDKRELVFRAPHVTVTFPLWDKFPLLALVRGAPLGDCDYYLLLLY